MTIYTVVFVRPDSAVPDLEMGRFPSLRAAMESAAEMAQVRCGPIHARVLDQNRLVAVIPLNHHPCEIASASARTLLEKVTCA